jgi:DNA topoisomerase-1
LEQLDFIKIQQHLEKVKEEKKNKPNETKKKEMEERNKNNARYQYCVIDGGSERVTNFMIEPPGIFRGRGEHPHMGKIKQRVVPEFVTINCGFNDVIPPCPVPGHSWKKCINNTEAAWLCHFKDEKSSFATSGKYLALAAESRLKGLNDKQKYERAKRLKACVDKVRDNYKQIMAGQSRELQ